MKNKLILFLTAIIFISLQTSRAQDKKDYTVIDYSTTIEEGNELDINHLFDGDRRKITQVTMRNGKSLGSHSVKMPFLIYCASGEGELVFDDYIKVNLKPGSMITIEANVQYDVIAKPKLSFLLIRFMEDKIENQSK